MKVKVLKTDERLGIFAGEIYNAAPYHLDPSKLVLDSRIPDGYQPMCTQYRNEVEIQREAGPAKLKKVEVSKGKPIEIQIFWDNDRRQVVQIPDDSPQALIFSIKKLTDILETEIKAGNI